MGAFVGMALQQGSFHWNRTGCTVELRRRMVSCSLRAGPTRELGASQSSPGNEGFSTVPLASSSFVAFVSQQMLPLTRCFFPTFVHDHTHALHVSSMCFHSLHASHRKKHDLQGVHLTAHVHSCVLEFTTDLVFRDIS